MRSKFLIVLASLVLPVANAADISDQLMQCRTVQNDLQRLACYDKMGENSFRAPAAVANELQATEIAPTATTSSPAAVAAITESFGIEHKIAEKAVTSITSVVVKLEQSKRGFWTVTLDNGQQWRQITSDGFVLRKGEEVVISRGAFNSFLLAKKDAERQTKVVRLQE